MLAIVPRRGTALRRSQAGRKAPGRPALWPERLGHAPSSKRGARSPAEPALPQPARRSPREFQAGHVLLQKEQSLPEPETARPTRSKCGPHGIARPAASHRSASSNKESRAQVKRASANRNTRAPQHPKASFLRALPETLAWLCSVWTKHASSSKNFLRNYLWSTATKELAVEVRAKMEVSKRGLMPAVPACNSGPFLRPTDLGVRLSFGCN